MSHLKTVYQSLPILSCLVLVLLVGTSVASAKESQTLHPIAAGLAEQLAEVDQPFILIVEMKVTEENRSALLEALKVPHKKTNQEPGALEYEVSVSVENPNELVLYERWVSLAALDSHLKQPYLKKLLADFGELLAEPPKVSLMKPLLANPNDK